MAVVISILTQLDAEYAVCNLCEENFCLRLNSTAWRQPEVRMCLLYGLLSVTEQPLKLCMYNLRREAVNSMSKISMKGF